MTGRRFGTILFGLFLLVVVGAEALVWTSNGRVSQDEVLPVLVGVAALLVIVRLVGGSSWRPSLHSSGVSTDPPQQPESQPAASSGVVYHMPSELEKTEAIVVSVEDVPLDNRYGSSTLTSEHEFSHTAVSSIKLDRSQTTGGAINAQIWSVLEAGVKTEAAKRSEIEIGQQVTRRVTLNFQAAAGKFVRYRVLWKQNAQHGMVSVDMDHQSLSVPITVLHGLYHSVESVSDESP